MLSWAQLRNLLKYYYTTLPLLKNKWMIFWAAMKSLLVAATEKAGRSFPVLLGPLLFCSFAAFLALGSAKEWLKGSKIPSFTWISWMIRIKGVSGSIQCFLALPGNPRPWLFFCLKGGCLWEWGILEKWPLSSNHFPFEIIFQWLTS